MLKKYFFILTSFSLLLVGCSNEEEKQINKKDSIVVEEHDKIIQPVLSIEEMETKSLEDFKKNLPNFTDYVVKEISITQDFEVPNNNDKKQKEKIIDVYGVIFHFSYPKEDSNEYNEFRMKLNKLEERLVSIHATEMVYFYDVTNGEFVYETVMNNEDVTKQIEKMEEKAHSNDDTEVEHSDENGENEHTHEDGTSHSH